MSSGPVHQRPTTDGAPTEVIEFDAGPLGFDAWLAAVDAEVLRITEGFGHEDFADWEYAAAFEDGLEPVEAARMALAEDSTGRQFLELAGIDVELVF